LPSTAIPKRRFEVGVTFWPLMTEFVTPLKPSFDTGI
jgi:hypothetical protein